MRILLDIDGVLGHFTAGARQWAAECHALSFTEDQITDYNIMTSFGLPNGWPSFIEWLSESRFCSTMPVYEGAADFVEALRTLGEVVAVTAPFVGVNHWESDRRRWLEQHFAIGHKDLVFCKRKELVRGDLLIEDSADNIAAFERAQLTGHPFNSVLLTRPWNRDAEVPARAGTYREVLGLVSELRDRRRGVDPVRETAALGVVAG